jgi:hypothetical protein
MIQEINYEDLIPAIEKVCINICHSWPLINKCQILEQAFINNNVKLSDINKTINIMLALKPELIQHLLIRAYKYDRDESYFRDKLFRDMGIPKHYYDDAI